MRHAKSSWKEPDAGDFDRPLTPRGRKSARKMGQYLLQNQVQPDLMLVSPARRTEETARYVIKALSFPKDQLRLREEIYEADLQDLLALLAECAQAPACVMLLGHNPGLQELLQHLVGPLEEVAGKAFPTATVARLSMPERWSRLGPRSASLIECVRPRFLAEP
jgi:phosphohistidine phosphatase